MFADYIKMAAKIALIAVVTAAIILILVQFRFLIWTLLYYSKV